MANGKSSSARRREVRRNVPKPAPTLLTHLRRKEVAWAAGFVVAFAVIASVFAVRAREHPTYKVGQFISRPIVTPVAFDATDKQETQRRKEVVRQNQPALYQHNEAYLRKLQSNFGGLIALADYETIEEVKAEDRQQLRLTQEGLDALRSYLHGDEPGLEWQASADEFLRRLFDLAILSRKNFEDEKSVFGADKVIIHHPSPRTSAFAEQIRDGRVLINIDDPKKIREEVEFQSRLFPAALQPTVVALVLHEPQPTYLRNNETTQQRKDEAYEREPTFTVEYEANRLVIPAGTRLDDSGVDLLWQMNGAVLAKSGTANIWLTRAGTLATMLLILAGMWMYVSAFNPRVMQNPMRGMALTVLLLSAQVVAVVASRLLPEELYLTATLPTLLGAIVLAIAYDQRFAFAIGSVLAVLVLLSLRLPIGVGVVMLTGIAVALSQLREVRTRSKLVWVGLWSGLAMALAALVAGTMTRPLYLADERWLIVVDAMWAAGSGMLTGLLAQGVLPIIERLFNVTTALTLKDLNDAGRPLLQRLAQEAPGTYQHSLRIADMAEGAAEAIGADSLTCRVGAMYHDIGKVNKPMYFIENQGGGPNRHAKLSPAMSLLIVVGHVKDGIEIAREYSLPAVIRHCIESHHGTTLVEYFYHEAKKKTEGEDKREPSEFEFRYPGPKPRTREAAIMLLCDGVEAAARSLPDPTPVRLEQLVHTIANKRLMDGQFDESNMTLAELHKIEQAITKTLCAIYHARIKYPSDDADREDAEQTRTA